MFCKLCSVSAAVMVCLAVGGCGSATDDNSSFSGGGAANDEATSSEEFAASSTSNASTTPVTTAPAPENGLQEVANEIIPDPVQGVSSERIFNFLWKPESERNGLLVILVNPRDVTIRVTGSISETLANSGASNGRGTTARSSFSGCAFGNNVVVEFFDGAGRRILVRDGSRSVRIPSGCDRFEFVI